MSPGENNVWLVAAARRRRSAQRKAVALVISWRALARRSHALKRLEMRATIYHRQRRVVTSPHRISKRPYVAMLQRGAGGAARGVARRGAFAL